jgi:glycosyltransferase involved in cell wall biosynthesis
MEIIEYGKYGRFFESNNFHSLSNKLNEIIENYDSPALKYMVDQAFEHVCSNFSIKQTAKKYLEYYGLSDDHTC